MRYRVKSDSVIISIFVRYLKNILPSVRQNTKTEIPKCKKIVLVFYLLLISLSKAGDQEEVRNDKYI